MSLHGPLARRLQQQGPMPRDVRFFCPQAAPQLGFSNGIPQSQRDDEPEVVDAAAVADQTGGFYAHWQAPEWSWMSEVDDSQTQIGR